MRTRELRGLRCEGLPRRVPLHAMGSGGSAGSERGEGLRGSTLTGLLGWEGKRWRWATGWAGLGGMTGLGIPGTTGRNRRTHSCGHGPGVGYECTLSRSLRVLVQSRVQLLLTL